MQRIEFFSRPTEVCRIDWRIFDIHAKCVDVLSLGDILEHGHQKLRADLIVTKVEVEILEFYKSREVKKVLEGLVNPDLVARDVQFQYL